MVQADRSVSEEVAVSVFYSTFKQNELCHSEMSVPTYNAEDMHITLQVCISLK
jgi:hypothetical protein